MTQGVRVYIPENKPSSTEQSSISNHGEHSAGTSANGAARHAAGEGGGGAKVDHGRFHQSAGQTVKVHPELRQSPKEKRKEVYIFPKRALNPPTLAGSPRKRKTKVKLKRKDFEKLQKVCNSV